MNEGDLQQALLAEFQSETLEILERVERELLQMERHAGDPQGLHRVFREMHTAKGSCRLMGFQRMEGLAHRAEGVLSRLRAGELPVDAMAVGLLLRANDALRSTINGSVRQTGQEGAADYSVLLAALDAMLERPSVQDVVTDAADAEEAGGLDLFGDAPRESPGIETESMADIAPGAALSSGDDHVVRLPLARLEQLMDLVGELNSAFNQMVYRLQHAPLTAGGAMEEVAGLIHRLQEETLQYRMQPIGRLWEPFHRLVRDLCHITGKKAQLFLEGVDTEVDRSLVNAIREPLGHLLRNAVDHGIEPPGVREARGKPAEGVISLNAWQRQGRIWMELRDDGHGIDADRVRDKASRMQLLDAERLARMGRNDLLQLVFAPGLSTAEQVSAISGRGAGLDAVRAMVTGVGGGIEVHSEPGQGTRFLMHIPQTMAIVPSLLVRQQQVRYAIPQSAIVELMAFYGSRELAGNVEFKMGEPMVRHRSGMIPLVPMETALVGGMVLSARDAARSLLQRGAVQVVVLRHGDQLLGLAVEEILETANLVIRPLVKLFSHIRLIAGSCILADGQVALVIDAAALADLIRGDREGHERCGAGG
ncbi:MAG: chemotaxis protein CheA [Magnetococcus sp. WYHC-3]